MRTATPLRPWARRWAAALALGVSAAAASPAAPDPSAPGPVPGAQCRTQIHGSTARAVCHNPDPAPVQAQLHIACRRWWDPAVDTRRAYVGPAATVFLAGHCWKEIRAAWITLR